MTHSYIEYKGYIAPVEYDAEDDVLVASVANMEKQAVYVWGHSIAELKTSLNDAVDAHIESCKEWGIKPEEPFSGRITYRTSPQTHAELVKAAAKMGKNSLNAFIEDAVQFYTKSNPVDSPTTA